MWELPIPTREQKQKTVQSKVLSNNVNNSTTTTLHDHIQFLYQAMGSPVKRRLIEAIKRNYLKSWPNFTQTNVQKYIHHTVENDKGHMQQTRKNKSKLRKKSSNEIEIKTEETNYDTDDYFPNSRQERTNSTFITLISTQGLVATDLTGAFLITSAAGNKYIMLWYNYDSNTFKSIPLKSKFAEAQTAAYNKTYEFYVLKGFKPRVHKMDNEASDEFLTNLDDKAVRYQLVPPNMQQQNPAESSIRPWKQHFKARAAT